MASSFDEELGELVSDVEKLLLDNDDTERIERCAQLSAECDGLWRDQEADAKALVKKLTAQVEKARKDAEVIAARTPSSPEIEALENERKELQEKIDGQSVDKESVLKEVEQLERKVEELERNLEQVKLQTQQRELPQMAYQMQLYASVTNIKWNWADCTKNQVGGCVINPTSGSAKTFNVSLQEKSSVEVANQLWSIVGGAC